MLPIANVPLVKEMVVFASTTKASANSSKFNELDVTPLPENRDPPILSCETEAVPDTSKLVVTDAPLEKVHTPETVSFCDNEAGPPAPQSKATVTSNAPEAVKAKWAPEKDIDEMVESSNPDPFHSLT